MKKFAFSFILLLIFSFVSAINAQIKDGDLIKGSKENVYLVIEKKACWIPSKDIFDALKLDWKAVKPIEDAKLKVMAKGSLIFKNKAGNYWLSLNDKVASIGDAKMLKTLGLNEKFVRDLSDAEIAKLSTVPFIIKGKKAAKYLFVAGKVSQFSSDKALKALGYDPSLITTVDDKGLAGLPKIPFLVKGAGEKVYLVEKDKLRWISSEELFKKNNYDWNTVQKIDDKVLKALPEGEPVK